MKHLLLTLTLALTACTLTPTTPEKPGERIALSWEAGKPERAAWSDSLINRLEADWAIFDGAKDMSRLCPRYTALTKAEKLKAWGEFWVALFYYESGWNPKSASVDVGKASDRNTHSIGLGQISQVDQSWAGGGTKYSYNELLTVEPNIHLSTVIMRRQVKSTGLIVLPNSSKYRYWAVALDGNKYSKVDEIAARVRKNVSACQ